MWNGPGPAACRLFPDMHGGPQSRTDHAYRAVDAGRNRVVTAPYGVRLGTGHAKPTIGDSAMHALDRSRQSFGSQGEQVPQAPPIRNGRRVFSGRLVGFSKATAHGARLIGRADFHLHSRSPASRAKASFNSSCNWVTACSGQPDGSARRNEVLSVRLSNTATGR